MTEPTQHPQPVPCPRTPLLRVLDAQSLMDIRFRRQSFLIEGLLKPGLAVLAGSPKIGKSWLVMQLCMSVASGEPFWGMPTLRSTALYIALEDSPSRLQERLLRIGREAPPELYFTTRCSAMGEEFVDELSEFVADHPDTRLVVIDTYQKIRSLNSQPSYANDYLETSALKCLADKLNLCILLVHHTRKMTDSDCMNEISGTNGIAGSADTLMVLKKEKRTDREAQLTATGRDIEDRELSLRLDRSSCVWEVVTDSLSPQDPQVMPPILHKLIDYVKQIGIYDGNNGIFVERLAEFAKQSVDTVNLKRLMGQFRYDLEDHGVFYQSYRTSSMRLMLIKYVPERDRSAEHPSGGSP